MTEMGVRGALRDLVALAEAAVLPVVGGVLGDDKDSYGLQAGAFAVEFQFCQAVLTSRGMSDIRGRRDNYHWAAGIINLVLAVIEWLELLNGYGKPDMGSEFNAGATTFGDHIFAILDSASAVDWSGVGAEEYNRQNKLQEARLANLAKTDRRIAGLLREQAAEVELGRAVLAGARLVVVGLIVIIGVGWIPVWERQPFRDAANPIEAAILGIGYLSYQFLLIICLSVIGTAAGAIGALIDQGIRHGNRIHDAMQEGYQGVIDDVNAMFRHSVSNVVVAKASEPIAVPAFAELAGNVSAAVDTFAAAGPTAESQPGRIPSGGIASNTTGPLDAPSQACLQPSTRDQPVPPYARRVNQASAPACAKDDVTRAGAPAAVDPEDEATPERAAHGATFAGHAGPRAVSTAGVDGLAYL